MKYDWPSRNTTYLKKCHHEDTVTYLKKCHHEDTVIFDDVIKPHFIKVEVTLRAHAHLDQRSAVFNEHRFDTCLSILTLNTIFNYFHRFLIVQFVHKSPCDFSNCEEIQEKKQKWNFHRTLLSEATLRTYAHLNQHSTVFAYAHSKNTQRCLVNADLTPTDASLP